MIVHQNLLLIFNMFILSIFFILILICWILYIIHKGEKQLFSIVLLSGVGIFYTGIAESWQLYVYFSSLPSYYEILSAGDINKSCNANLDFILIIVLILLVFMAIFVIGLFFLKRNSNRLSYRNEQGDYKYNKLLYLEDIASDYNSTNLCIYNIGEKSGKILGNVKAIGFEEIKAPVFKDEHTVFFIGCKDVGKDDFYEDIYEMNLTTKEITQITFTNNEKASLRYYE